MQFNGVSIIIPALNEEKVIGQCLTSLARMEALPASFEVIVVDNGSTDHTRDIAQSFSGALTITVLEKPDVHVSALRNFGVDYARGSILAFLDADCLVSPDWLHRAVALLSAEGTGVVGAHFRIPEESQWVARAWYGKLETERQGSLQWVPGCNTWVTRETFERVGRFDESIETNEDCEFCGRVRAAGLRIMGHPEIAVIHLGAPAGVKEFYRKISWHATDGLRVFLRDPLALMNARPVLFGAYTLVCLAAVGIGGVLMIWQKRFDVLAASLGALLAPSFLLSIRLVLKRNRWADLFPLTLLNLVYGLARGRSLLVARNWAFPAARPLTVVPVHVILFLCLIFHAFPVFAASAITAIWANDGGDKVTQRELRATAAPSAVFNSVWDGTTISIFGGRNEVVAFNVILEAAAGAAGNVRVSFNSLSGPSGSAITSSPASGNGIFDWTRRQIEVFYIRYVQIKGLSKVSYETYDERHVPRRMRRPWSGNGVANGSWQSRPDHDKFYPEIAVPMELVPTFTIVAGSNQSVWVDVFIPRNAEPGLYVGNALIQENGVTVKSVPVKLQVYNFTLPDTPSAKTMLVLSSDNINKRYLGNTWVNPASAAGVKARMLRDRHFQMAHRHRVSMIGDTINDCVSPGDQPCPEWQTRLDGSLFTAANGYDGPGINTGNNVYSIGTYGVWGWKSGGQSAMHQHSDAWVTWFEQNAPGSDYFLYLIDESTNTAQIQTWAQWILNNSGPGRRLKSMATIPLTTAATQSPDLDIPTTTLGVGVPGVWQPLADRYTTDARKRFYMYNARRPASGSMATEDDGIAMREMAWGQFKKKINRWFIWESTYYNNNQGSMGETNVFRTAQTFGTKSVVDPVLGESGWLYSNGDGVLFYPGTDVVYPSDSYGVDGPFASLRLKQWRRGLQDADYLTLASAVNPAAVQTLIKTMVPKVLWEYGVDDVNDPTYVHTDVSWPSDPNTWEAARGQLAGLIAGQGSLVAPILNLPSTLPVTAEIRASYPSGYSISTYQWTFTLSTSLNGAQASHVAFSPHASIYTFTTANGAVPLGPLKLPLGDYLISVTITDPTGRISPPATAFVTLVASELSGMRVYPKPWRADRHSGAPITFDRLTSDAAISIFTLSGHEIVRLRSSGGMATWDLTNTAGDRVASGLYLYVVKTSGSPSSRGKLAIIR